MGLLMGGMFHKRGSARVEPTAHEQTNLLGTVIRPMYVYGESEVFYVKPVTSQL